MLLQEVGCCKDCFERDFDKIKALLPKKSLNPLWLPHDIYRILQATP